MSRINKTIVACGKKASLQKNHDNTAIEIYVFLLIAIAVTIKTQIKIM